MLIFLLLSEIAFDKCHAIDKLAGKLTADVFTIQVFIRCIFITNEMNRFDTELWFVLLWVLPEKQNTGEI